MSNKNKPASYWITSTGSLSYDRPSYPVLRDGLETEVAIVGGGLTGITAGYLLKQAGVRVAIIESRKILHGTTGHTTAKITSQHGLIYDYLIEKHGFDTALKYARANQSAVEFITRLVSGNSIDCDFEVKPAYVYTESESFIKNIEREVDAALKLGLPASYVTDTGLPFDVKCAIRFDNQAQFHPLKYLYALARQIPDDNNHIFEQTRVMDIKTDTGSLCTVITDRGEIRTQHVIIASHFPIKDKPQLYFARMYQSRSYVIAIKAKERLADGYFISADAPVHSFRSLATDDGQLIMVGGEGHKVGQGEDTNIHYKRLEEYANRIFNVSSVDYRWSAQDCMTFDSIPFIGTLGSRTENIYVATGYRKWGMTNGTAAAIILSDRILGRDNPWEDAFSPRRINPTASAGQFVKENVNVAGQLIGGKLDIPGEHVRDVKPGEGKIVMAGTRKVAVFRDNKGTIHALDPACTHLGCNLSFNQAEKTWDCPCHGSRFDIEGRVIQSPAVKDLEKLELAGEDSEQEEYGQE